MDMILYKCMVKVSFVILCLSHCESKSFTAEQHPLNEHDHEKEQHVPDISYENPGLVETSLSNKIDRGDVRIRNKRRPRQNNIKQTHRHFVQQSKTNNTEDIHKENVSNHQRPPPANTSPSLEPATNITQPDVVPPLPEPYLTNVTGSGDTIVSGDTKLLPQTNLTALINHFHRNSTAQDATSATICVAAILILLFALILYSRMWQKKDQWLNMTIPQEDSTAHLYQGIVPVTTDKLSIKDLIENKLQMIYTQFQKIRKSKKFKGLQMNGHYKRVRQSDTSVEHSDSEEEVFTR